MITYGMVVAAYIIMQGPGGNRAYIQPYEGTSCSFLYLRNHGCVPEPDRGVSWGELSLGHAGFMCVGAFAGALFSKCMKGAIDPTVSLVIAVIIGAAVAAVFGVLIGIPVLRLKGDYLAIVTLAFGEIIKNIINAASSV